MPVEVILKTKIEGLGAEADIVNVKPGFARNFLFPRGMAAVATAASKKQIEELKRKRAEREAKELNEAQEYAGKLGKVKLTFTMTAGSSQDKVFGAVTTQDIADKLKEAGYSIDKKQIDLARPIKDLGIHEVSVKLLAEVQAKVKVEVVSAVTKEPTEVKKGRKSDSKKSDKSEKSDKAEASK